MSMTRAGMFMGRLLAATWMGVFAGCQGEPTQEESVAASQSQEVMAAPRNCVQRFEGISHCGTGSAALKSTDDGLVVTGLHNLEQDGVVGVMGRAESWRQKSIVDFGASDEGIRFYGRNEDQVISTLALAPDPSNPDGGMRMLPTFTGSPGGSSYAINVRNQGEMVAMMLPHRWWEWSSVQIWAYMDRMRHPDLYFGVEGFGVTTGVGRVGACIWRVRFQEGAFTVTLEDGRQVAGDEIEFVEQLDDGAYPYSAFTHIGMTGAVDSLTIVEETVVQSSK
ncbi:MULTISPECIES: hypothetical protein [unclassified Corallococcus]|uniref:hypothetical protein n=1 Tax=unclassified Corallococcus TaxID=2685029 RepID=UPI001A8FFE81|nr:MULTISPECIES: hypothetical protein [unclassified Corallococcus]MBN9687763.1 hypothetical protein [Corallococcus sp. NCSPR001]WAS88425.1 hypothetical protein O0N60_15895 [Corallococcus sp. NCRR]